MTRSHSCPKGVTCINERKGINMPKSKSDLSVIWGFIFLIMILLATVTCLGVVKKSLPRPISHWDRYEIDKNWRVQLDLVRKYGSGEDSGSLRLYRKGRSKTDVASLTGHFTGNTWTKITWYKFTGRTGLDSYVLVSNRWYWQPDVLDKENVPPIPRTEILRAIAFFEAKMTNSISGTHMVSSVPSPFAQDLLRK